MEDKSCIFESYGYGIIKPPKTPLTTFYMIDNRGYRLEINIDKKFNWFQKKMIKWCFGFDVKENSNDTRTTD